MASFTDNQPLSFTPYTPNVDTNLYASVLAYKQGQYDQGVQRVQGTLDTVSGIELARDVDKAYLQGKVQALTGSINSLQNPDWGNTQLTSTIQGAASKVYRDKKVQNALISTQSLKALMASQKELKEKHPDMYTPSAEYRDNQYIQRYLQNPEVGRLYDGPKEASRYYAYDGEIRKALKDLSPEISYKIGPNGTFEYIFDKTSTITLSKIQQVVDGVISSHPEFQQSIQMDADYSLKDYDGPSLLGKINNFTSAQVANLEKLNEYYLSEKMKDPKNPSVVKWADGHIADNQHNINLLQQNARKYQGYVAQGASMADIKRTYFMDNLRNTYGLNYQMENHEIDYKTNQNAVHAQQEAHFRTNTAYKAADLEIAQKRLMMSGEELWMRYIEQGIDPETKQAITPDSKYWAAFQNAHVGTDKDGSSTSGAAGANGETYQTGTAGTAEAFTSAANNTKIQELEGSILKIRDTLQEDWLNDNNISTRDATSIDQFNAWEAEQLRHFKAQDGKVDPLYRDYILSKQDLEAEKSAFTGLRARALQVGVDKHSIGEVKDVIKMDGLRIVDPKTGKVTTKLEVPIAGSQQFLTELQMLTNRIAERESKEIPKPLSGDYSRSGTIEIRRRIAQEEFERAKGGQWGHILSALFLDSKGSTKGGALSMPNFRGAGEQGSPELDRFRERADKILAPVKTVSKNRAEETEKYLLERGKQFNYNYVNLQEDTKRAQKASGIAAQAMINRIAELEQQKGGDGDGEPIAEFELAKLKPLAAYYDINEQGWVEYEYAGQVYKDKITSNNPIIAQPDPGMRLRRIIDMSPNNKTTPLVTSNGKVTYTIGKRGLNNTYYLSVVDGAGNAYNVPIKDASGDHKAVTNPLELRKAIEDLSKMDMTTEQILEYVRQQYNK